MTRTIADKIKDYTFYGHRTLLGVGPMSQNIVDVTIEIAEKYNAPLMLIASRRQVDSELHGGGYVNNWTTETFSEYVKSMDHSNNIVMARDHGGPWQNENEKKNNLTLKEAMESAKRSYEADIDAGFRILHIDPSVSIDGGVSPKESLNRAFELYHHCWEYAQHRGADISFEIGTEEQQAGGIETLDDLKFQLTSISKFCSSNKLPMPLYIVVQTGTKVMELRNVGSFDSDIRVDSQIASEIIVPKIVDMCRSSSILMKQHNTDYLSDAALKAHPLLGIHAANVAPEFGVAETLGLFEIFDGLGLNSQKDRFIELSLKSKKWEKWMLPGSSANDIDKTKICGHYVFGSNEFHELKSEINTFCRKSGICLDEHLKAHVRRSIMRYIKAFRLENGVTS